MRNSIINSTPDNIHKQFLESQNEKFRKSLAIVRRHQNKKFEWLLEQQITRDIYVCFNESWIENTTDVQLPVEMKLLLSFGPKFCLNSSKVSEKDCFKLISDIENILKCVQNNREKLRIRNNLVGFIQNKILSSNSALNRTDKYLNHILMKTINFIKNYNEENPDKEIMITVSDKGGKSVVIFKNEYMKQMQNLLDDRSTYFEIKKDPTIKFQNLNNKLVKFAKDKKMMDEWTRRSLNIHKSATPTIYLLPKIGARIMKFRPIVSCVNGPSYKIGQIIHKSIDHERYNIKNSYEFQKFIVTTLDVVNLLGCIPRWLIFECIIYEWDSIKENTELSRSMFLKMVRFIFRSSYFVFNGKFHGQWEGSGMGLPPSPNFADLVMTCLFFLFVIQIHPSNQVAKGLLNYVKKVLDFEVLFVKKYVDDLVLSIPKGKIAVLLEMASYFDIFEKW
jgi:hypothetical protein